LPEYDMKLIAVGCALSLASSESDFSTGDAFQRFKTHFNKTYFSIHEEEIALSNFVHNLEVSEQRNNEISDYATYGITKFVDMSEADFKKTYLNRKPTDPVERNLPLWDGKCTACETFPDMNTTMDSVDWVAKGAVSKVKDQGSCGSCWAFGTTGDVEGTTFLATGKLVSLSEQQLVSCDKKENDGCNGGLQEDAFKYVEKTGLTTEANYKYTSIDGKRGSCKDSKIKGSLTTVSNWFQVSSSAKDEAKIKQTVAQTGPVTIGINADHGFQTYKKGILNPKKCPGKASDLDHAVLIVGYGTENGVDYWKIKNSWGTDWGENGYFRVGYGVNKCGVAADAVHSVA